MKKNSELITKIFCIFLCFCIAIPTFQSFAQETVDNADGLCQHHSVHDTSCGYTDAITGNACTHAHDDTCGYAEAVEAKPCIHVHDDLCGYTEDVDDSCIHIHDETCGYTEAADAEPCTHEHDAECGYAEAAEGTPCTYECKLCACDCETDDPDIHATTCPAYTAPENPVCYCAEKCTKDTVNVWCDVCGIDGIETCKGEDTAEAYATKSVSYVECSWDGTKVVKTRKTVTATVLTSGAYYQLTDEWYVVEGNVSIKADPSWDPYISINHMKLILADGCNLTVEGTIKVNWPSSSINIYGQDNGTGKMKVVATGIESLYSSCAAIGVVNIPGQSLEPAGSMYIHGGNVEAIGTDDAAGIGGAKDRAGGDIWIYDGTVTATGGNYGAGIGGGGGDKDNHGGNITIYGGTVNATGKQGGAGLGGGNNGAGGNIKIYGGTVNANGADGGAGIGGGCNGSGGNIIIQSGSVTAGGNGIGCGNEGSGGSFGTGENGNAIVNGVSLSDKSDIANWSGIINGVVYGQQKWSGDFVWNGNLNFAQGAKLDVNGNIKITLDDGSVITSLKDLRIGGITLKEKEVICDDQEHIPEVSVHTGEGITLEEGKHYSLSYWRDGTETKDFISEGTITVRAKAISGSGYTGSIETTFQINDVSIYLNDVVCVESNPANGQRLFDGASGSTSTEWQGKVESDQERYCIFKLPIPVKIGEYILLSADASSGRWTDWTIYGGTSQAGPWTEIHKVVDAKLKTDFTIYGNENGPFVLPYETQAYQYYKLVINGSVLGNSTSQNWYAPEMYLRRHSHTWNFSTNGGVTTVDCVCGAKGTVTIDIPAMEKVTYGYAQPAAQKFSISESGDWNGIIDSITLSGTNATSFILNAANKTIQPKSGLDAKTHSANILVTYKDGSQISAPFTFTVDAADLKNVQVQQEGTLTYNTEPQTAQVKASGEAVNQQEITFTYSKEENGTYTEDMPSFTEAGTHNVYYKASAPNHKEYVGTFSVTIGKSDNTVHITGDLDKTYDAAAVSEPSYTAYGTGDVTIEYKKKDADDSTYSTTAPSAAGTYVVRVTKAEDKNYFQGSATKEFTIAKAGLTVTAENKTVSYGDDVPGYTVTYDGFHGTDTAASLDGTLTFDCPYKKFDDKGEYTITPSGYTSGNYDISYEKGILTVNPKSITVTIEGKTSIYGDETNPLTAVTDGIVNNDEAVYELSTAASKTASVGNYDITGTTLDENYSISFAGGEDAYEITPRELTVSVEVADKKYDGLYTAVITKAELVNIANKDEVSLQNGVATFETSEVKQDINIEFTPFSLVGKDDVLKNYTLIQPTGITASITNDWVPVEDVDYTVSQPNGNGWMKEDFVIRPVDGYQISLDDSASGTWSDKLTYSDEKDNGTVTFYLKDKDDGTISLGKTVTYMLDKTPATGKVIFDERNGWESFVNSITFDLFYKDPVQVEVIELKDNLSDIESVEYVASGEAMALHEVEQLDSWEAMDGNVVGVDMEDTKQFVYFIRITDKAGNITYLSTNGAEYDTKLPVIEGIVDGSVYYTTQEVTITDKNLDVVTLNDNSADNTITLVGNTDTTYTVKAVDKAGNTTTVTVTMKPISDLSVPMDALTKDNVNSEDSQTLEDVSAAVAAVDTADATDDEKTALQEILDKVDVLETVIEETTNEMTRLTEELQKYDSNNVNSDDVEALVQLTEDIKKLTDADNLSDAERAALDTQVGQIVGLQEIIDKTTAENDRIADAEAGYDLSKVTSANKDALEELLGEIEKQMESTNLTEKELAQLDKNKQAVTDLLDQIGDISGSIDQIEKSLSGYSEDDVKSADKDALEQLIKDIDALLATDNLTEDEEKALKEDRTKVVALLETIKKAKQDSETEDVKKVKDITPENVKPGDKAALEKAKADLETALKENGGNYTSSEKKAIEAEINRITAAIDVIVRVETVSGLIDKLPDTVSPDDADVLTKLNAAQKAYDAMTSYEKSLIDKDLKAKLEELLAAAVSYEVTKGNGSQWTAGSNGTLCFTVNGLFEKFLGVQVDGKDLKPGDYEAESGSTIITLKRAYLETLAEGKHTITVLYTDGSASGTFVIESIDSAAAHEMPDTGDGENLMLWLAIMITGAIGLPIYIRKRKA